MASRADHQLLSGSGSPPGPPYECRRSRVELVRVVEGREIARTVTLRGRSTSRWDASKNHELPSDSRDIHGRPASVHRASEIYVVDGCIRDAAGYCNSQGRLWRTELSNRQLVNARNIVGLPQTNNNSESFI